MDTDESTARLQLAKAEYSPGHYDEVLQEVGDRIRANGSASKADIGALVFWKRIQANTTWARELHRQPDAEVRRITGLAFEAVTDKGSSVPQAAQSAREELRQLPGCRKSYSLASALLVAAAPDRMAVYDRRAHSGLSKLGIHFPYRDGYGAYMTVIESLRQQINTTASAEWSARDVDLALFMLGA